MSSADGAGPYLASNPRKDRVSSFPVVESDASAMIWSMACVTSSPGVRPFAFATALSFASFCGSSGRVIVMLSLSDYLQWSSKSSYKIQTFGESLGKMVLESGPF